MPFNGSGVFVRGLSWVNDATNNIPISAPRMDADTNDIVGNGLGLCLTRDGQGSATANLPMNGFRHTGAGAAVNPNDYVILTQLAPLATLASPAFTGSPTAPTPSNGTNNTQIATTAFVNTALGSYLPLGGGTLSGGLTAQSFTLNDVVNSPSRNVVWSTAGIARWSWNMFNNEGGGNSGADLQLINFNNSGGAISQVMFCQRSSGNVTFGNGVTTNGILQASAQLVANSNFIYGGTTQPHVFVQSGTPTAVFVGDLWFF